MEIYEYVELNKKLEIITGILHQIHLDLIEEEPEEETKETKKKGLKEEV